MRHTLVVDPAVPDRHYEGRGEDGQMIWRELADVTVASVRCTECDVEVGRVYDEVAARLLRAWWRPGHHDIPLGSVGYTSDVRYPSIFRDSLMRGLVADLEECHEVQMDALYSPVPRKRRERRPDSVAVSAAK